MVHPKSTSLEDCERILKLMIDGEWESSSQDPVPKCCARYQEIFGRTMQDPSKVRDFVLWCAVPSQQVICTPYQLSRDHQELADTVAGHIWAHIRPQQVAIEGSNCWFHWSSDSELWVSMSHRCGQHIAHWHRRNCITSPLNLGVEKSRETLCNFFCNSQCDSHIFVDFSIFS